MPQIVCLDMEGVLTPEIWIAFSEATGIPELRRTTRDEPDYDKLMRMRIGILAEHGLGLSDIQRVIGQLRPLPGAKEFLDQLRAEQQVIILSDTFYQFAAPLTRQLGQPTLFCNELVIDDEGRVVDYRLRVRDGKRRAVLALRDLGFRVLAAGDSVTLIKDLVVKGAGFTAKRGTAVRGISLVPDNAEQIEGRVEGQRIVILTKFVKKSN